LTKLTSKPLEAGGDAFCAVAGFVDCGPGHRPLFVQAGRPSERIFSSESTSAERLSDRRNVRRDENKRDTFPHWARAKIRASILT
jgi:hypothetical protein